ncbi:TetR/AcrR family transcriptional regulator [Streptomyces sp. NRRL F-2890]|uniref:TetR/AcrR family transcriptional regulator n=1 Tax=Streptomyces sp. NRRL F-2890 TaxID=1463845 RepID=UPI0005BA6675|nr:helix-turn-helix domain-containing protein [Streptomyces sp. NRRL F-2890]
MTRTDDTGGRTGGGGSRIGGLRVDARRNLRHVLSAARDVFGEQGYGAPMEEVARRARVGVGTVYRRFPSKEALVRYIAAEQTRWLTDRAAEALVVASDGRPWQGLEGFVRGSAASGSGRLLPPELWWARGEGPGAAPPAPEPRAGAPAEAGVGVPPAEVGVGVPPAEVGVGVPPAEAGVGVPPAEAGVGVPPAEAGVGVLPAEGWGRVPRQRAGTDGATGTESAEGESGATRELLLAVGQLVEQARVAGELRADVTVADVMLVIAAAPPRLTDPERQEAAAERLLEVLLRGLRPGRD